MEYLCRLGCGPSWPWGPYGCILDDRLAEVPAGRPVIVVCRSGGRSYRAAQALATRGYVSLNLAGGMHAWHDEGLPVVRDDGSPGVVV